jgi:DnaK suppressor protein
MKTVAKKVAKKATVKLAAKVAKPAAKKVSKPIAKPPVKVAKKPTATVAKPVKKVAAKTVAKSVAKPVVKAAAKKTVKVVAKPAVNAKAVKTTKTVVVPVKKISKSVQPAKSTKPSKVEKPVVKPVVKPVKAAKAEPKTTKVESKSKQPMVIASKTVPTESKSVTKAEAKADAIETIPAAPVLSKARTSRLASLTVPSMAQSIASTAAKSSYGPAVHSQTFIIPPHAAPKQNPKLANNWKNKTAEEMSDEELLAMPDSEYMNIKQMMYFRLKLIALKKGILESAGATTEHLRDESAVVPDPTDRATIEEEHALELRTRDRERKLLKKIEQSITRIDAGDYGYCDETGEAIGVGRLLARPTATLSLEAQQRRELKQKMFGD